jgi:hypothetical protein
MNPMKSEPRPGSSLPASAMVYFHGLDELFDQFQPLYGCGVCDGFLPVTNIPTYVLDSDGDDWVSWLGNMCFTLGEQHNCVRVPKAIVDTYVLLKRATHDLNRWHGERDVYQQDSCDEFVGHVFNALRVGDEDLSTSLKPFLLTWEEALFDRTPVAFGQQLSIHEQGVWYEFDYTKDNYTTIAEAINSSTQNGRANLQTRC